MFKVCLKGIFHAVQDVIDGPATLRDKRGADNFLDKILLQAENFIHIAVVQPLTQDGCHCPGHGLDVGPQRDPELCPVCLNTQVYTHSVYALFILADILNVKVLIPSRFPFTGTEGEINKVFAPFLFAERLECRNNFLKFSGVNHLRQGLLGSGLLRVCGWFASLSDA